MAIIIKAPSSLINIGNRKSVFLAGSIVCAKYGIKQVETIEELAMSVIDVL